MPDVSGAIGPVSSASPRLTAPHLNPPVVVPISAGTLPADTSIHELIDPATRQARKAITDKAATLGRGLHRRRGGPDPERPGRGQRRAGVLPAVRGLHHLLHPRHRRP